MKSLLSSSFLFVSFVSVLFMNSSLAHEPFRLLPHPVFASLQSFGKKKKSFPTEGLIKSLAVPHGERQLFLFLHFLLHKCSLEVPDLALKTDANIDTRNHSFSIAILVIF